MGHKGKNHLFTGMLIGTVLGGLYSMLFAQKKGAALRKELQDTYTKKGNVFEVFGKELGATGKESVKVMRELFESEGFQQFMEESKKKMDEWVRSAKKKGSQYTQEMQKKFEHLAKMASERAMELKENVEEYGVDVVEKSKRKLQGVKKNVTKKVRTAVNSFQKKVINK